MSNSISIDLLSKLLHLNLKTFLHAKNCPKPFSLKTPDGHDGWSFQWHGGGKTTSSVQIIRGSVKELMNQKKNEEQQASKRIIHCICVKHQSNHQLPVSEYLSYNMLDMFVFLMIFSSSKKSMHSSIPQVPTTVDHRHKYHHLTTTLHLTLNNSLSKDYLHPDDHDKPIAF